MQFEASSTTSHRLNHHGASSSNMNSSMYLPGMGRIAARPMISVQQHRTATTIGDHDLKKEKFTSSFEKPITVNGTTVKTTKVPVTTTLDSDACQNPAMESTQNEPFKVDTEKALDNEHQVIHYYRVWPGGPIQTFVSSTIPSERSNVAAILLQKNIRGMCTRTNYYVQRLERQVQQMNEKRMLDVQAVHDDIERQKVLVRRKVTQKQASLLKIQLDTKKTANEGSDLINYLRKENKKLRQKNDKIATSIAALKLHNEQLENLTCTTGENQNLLGSHYEKICETNTVLVSVVPQYESKMIELQEALEMRQQYCDVENRMKVMYMKLIGTITEMMEQDSNDPELVQEIMQYCADLPSDIILSTTVVAAPTTTSTTTATMATDVGCNHLDGNEQSIIDNNNNNSDIEEYDEVSIGQQQVDTVVSNHHHHPNSTEHEDEDEDIDASDSNNYDDYTIASME